jgi:uncharacterized protein YbaR (Trm112 family)
VSIHYIDRQNAFLRSWFVITDELLGMLRCPESRQQLKLADSDLVAEVNRLIAAGQVRNRAGQALARPVEGLLVRADDRLAYPVIDDIPILLVEEAMVLTPLKPEP